MAFVRALTVLAALVVLLGGCGGSKRDDVAESAAPKVRDISTLDDLKRTFNEDEGTPRLLLILSPT